MFDDSIRRTIVQAAPASGYSEFRIPVAIRSINISRNRVLRALGHVFNDLDTQPVPSTY